MFYAKVTWFKEDEDKKEIDHMMIPAKSYMDAVAAINDAFSDIVEIVIRDMVLSVTNPRIVYIPEDCVDKVLDINDDFKIKRALFKANIVGGLATKKQGAIGVVPSLEELDSFIKKIS